MSYRKVGEHGSHFFAHSSRHPSHHRTITPLEAYMARPVMTLCVNDRVEDRSFFSGAGHIAYLKGNEVVVRFDDGSEEIVTEECFKPHDPKNRVWTI